VARLRLRAKPLKDFCTEGCAELSTLVALDAVETDWQASKDGHTSPKIEYVHMNPVTPSTLSRPRTLKPRFCPVHSLACTISRLSLAEAVCEIFRYTDLHRFKAKRSSYASLATSCREEQVTLAVSSHHERYRRIWTYACQHTKATLSKKK
jgi:hypothetical protein